jgi:hypothetical protein
MIMQTEFIKNDFRGRLPSETSDGLNTENCPQEITTLQVDFPASRIPSPESENPGKMSVIFGQNADECYASYDPLSRSLRTSQGCLLLTEGDSSTEFCRTFTSVGMMRNGKLYPLRKPERPIFEDECGSFATKLGGGAFLAHP